MAVQLPVCPITALAGVRLKLCGMSLALYQRKIGTYFQAPTYLEIRMAYVFPSTYVILMCMCATQQV